MPDRIALPVLALVAAGLIALALVWPQGEGAPSPASFGHPLAPLTTPPAISTAAKAKSVATGQASEALRGPEPVGAHP